MNTVYIAEKNPKQILVISVCNSWVPAVEYQEGDFFVDFFKGSSTIVAHVADLSCFQIKKSR